MSAESQFHAALSAASGLTALVGARIAANAAPEGSGYPCVVFVVRAEPITTLLADDDEQRATISVQCWAASPADARSVADQVRIAVDAAPAARNAYVLSDATTFAEDLGLDGVELEVDWWP